MNWTELISDVVAGRWRDPDTGKSAHVPVGTIAIAETLDGQEADLLAPLALGRRLAVVSDHNTFEAMARRVGHNLKRYFAVDEVVLPPGQHCDEALVACVQERSRHADAVVAVGSGVVSDTCKYATFKDGRRYATFATAASMNGYAAATASVTLNSGYKTSLPAHAPQGLFIDLQVSANAPHWLSAAGLADSLCRPTAQVDWWTSHRLFGTFYSRLPYALTDDAERLMIAHAAGLKAHSVVANGYLHRVLILCGLGICFTGVSNHGSMGEHQVSHWIDMFAGSQHGGSTHGQQVGVASLAMARLQHALLAREEPPRIAATIIDKADFMARYGAEIGAMCFAEARKKAFDAEGARQFNDRLAAIWPHLRAELKPMLMDPSEMQRVLQLAGGPVTAAELGLSREIWRKAMKHARDLRNRWSFLDLADDASLLDDFLEHDAAT